MIYSRSRECAQRRNCSSNAGFTAIEILIVVVIISILAAIAIPSWLKFWANQQVIVARDELRSGIQQAQSAAIAHGHSWRFSLRETDNRIEWAVHANTTDWKDVKNWQALHPNLVLDPNDTTLAKKEGTYYVRFGFQGNVRYRLSTLTIDSRDGVAKNRCVVVSTLIGATRKGEEQLYPNRNGRYCY
ncbi:prepilin-type N-terminal cleavage/methylation domain-containing protein [Oscillatoria sp. CS-180]|uniref:GspH/FimT family pseudopilin n=1 Tax=Oscillatoria sp. CS-180 TaxID=3021720 RepID=UPI00232F6A60|nr:GspH/FimT family pseudopilin [Oscillatoria sp. CS-180]MDB9525018.1 prepilin-type N-terminal cleavage/methylation domain-containing protein [Oscillatoria sp. CS-180]